MKFGFVALAIRMVSASLQAEPRLAGVITDHAILQREETSLEVRGPLYR